MSTWVIDGFLWPECPRAHHLSTTYDDFPDVDQQMIYHTRGSSARLRTSELMLLQAKHTTLDWGSKLMVFFRIRRRYLLHQ